MANGSHTGRDGDEPAVNRRTAMSAGMAGLGSLFAIGSVTAANNEERLSPYESGPRGEKPELPRPRLRLGKNLKRLGENRIFLTGDKDQTLAYINNAPVGDMVRQQARENLKELWSQIDIERTAVKLEDGARQRRIALATDPDDAKSVFEKYEDRKLDASIAERESTSSGLGTVVESGMQSLISDGKSSDISAEGANNRDISPEWNYDDDHSIFAYYTGDNHNEGSWRQTISRDTCNVLKSHAPDPDNWEYDFDNFSIGDLLNTFEDAFPKDPARAYAHYFNPRYEVGQAPEFAEQYMNEAKNASGQAMWENCAYAIHFLHDMANPLHTASPHSALEQATFPTVHYDYENDCDDHLMWGDEDTDDVRNILLNNVHWDLRDDLTADDFKSVDDSPIWHPAGKYHLHCEDVAEASTDHSEYVLNTVYDHPSEPLESDSELETITESMFNYAQKYAMGYVEKINSVS